MKNILGLDLGTNSIGWALIQTDDQGNYQHEIKLGSRIIPMSQDVLGKFEGGAPTETQTAARTQKRGMRRLNERRLLRRERLHRVLHTLGFLPTHYDQSIGWDRSNGKTFGKFIDVAAEPKIAWKKDAQGKMQFLFQNSFAEMLLDFQKQHPELVEEGRKIPYDWTIYYLRDKALTRAVTKEELAWILLNFNQKRGYYQLRGDAELEQEVDKSKRMDYVEAIVVAIDTNLDEKETPKGRWYNVHLDNGMIYRRQSKESLDSWIGKKRDFIVTTRLNEDGTPKLNREGEIDRSFRSPGPDDWTLRKVRTEQNVEQSGMTVGSYIYRHLLEEPSDKIIGQFVQTIDRKFYKHEIYSILKAQLPFHPELTDSAMLKACSEELYMRNEARQKSLQQKDLCYLLVEDVLFYQRPLKSQKSLISNCPYECYNFVDRETGEVKIQHIKCVAKSNPYFQEYRIRQFIQNLKIYDTTGVEEIDVTAQYLKDKETLYQWMRSVAEVSQDSLFKDFLGLKKPKGKGAKFTLRWNYVEDKKYPAGETYDLLKQGFEKAGLDSAILNDETEFYRLWHLLYSIDDVNELKGALCKYADLKQLPVDDFVQSFSKLKPFDKDYGSYSEKALKKLLPLLRDGHSVHEACYEIYGRYSEGLETAIWRDPSDLHSYIMSFQQHSLRNPIVEQCILETLRTVADIWQRFGHIDEIHLELGREMKNPADKRKHIADQNRRNEATNLRIKALLLELLNDPSVEGVRPNSPMQQDILRLYEEGALLELKPEDAEYKDILEISQLSQPSASQLIRYKLWLQQRYRSPYTGRVIPLAKLFTSAYQIEHIIPRARYFDDSLGNKVICEAEVNKVKTNLLAHEFICQNEGRVISTTSGPVTVFKRGEYEQFVKDHYASLRNKLQRLMLDDVPEEFIQRQMNDSRYVSKVIKSLLSNIVREEGDDQDMSSNVIVCTGSVTDRLKKDWGMNDVWNHLVYPRYERLNQLTGTSLFGQWETKEGGKRVFQTSMPLTLQRGYSKKRIDHRHHAMDALVIACASRNIVNLLSNQNANRFQQREDLKHQLCGKGSVILKPWQTFTQDAETALSQIVVSFKSNVRVLTRATNRYEHYNEEGKKRAIEQTAGLRLAVRKPLHKDTIFAHVNLQRTRQVSLDAALSDVKNISDRALRDHIVDLFSHGFDKKKIKKQLVEEEVPTKVEVRYFTDEVEPMVAVRKALDDSFDSKRILAISDTGIQKILLAYLEAKGGDPKIAFSPDGIVELNEHIADYNDGKEHQPIRTVRVTEPMGEKYQVGYAGHKTEKYAEAQSGTNLYFAVYEKEDNNRTYATIPLNIVVERLKQGLTPVPNNDSSNNLLKFALSPNDLVYVPNEDEMNRGVVSVSDLKLDQIYRFVSSTKERAYFSPARIASPLLAINKEIDFGSNKIVVHEVSIGNTLGKIEREPDKPMIKAICWKLEVDRLGQITKIIR